MTMSARSQPTWRTISTTGSWRSSSCPTRSGTGLAPSSKREASLLGSDGETSTNIGAARDYYGYRSAEISAILDSEMSRVDAEMILGTQTVYYAIAEMVEEGVNRYFAEQGHPAGCRMSSTRWP